MLSARDVGGGQGVQASAHPAGWERSGPRLTSARKGFVDGHSLNKRLADKYPTPGEIPPSWSSPDSEGAGADSLPNAR